MCTYALDEIKANFQFHQNSARHIYYDCKKNQDPLLEKYLETDDDLRNLIANIVGYVQF